jgi:toxin ParE1/3/4
MSYRVIWSDFSVLQLDTIFDYYIENASRRVATNLISKIISKPSEIIHDPYIAQREDLLIGRKEEYRYLVCKNYKIIFAIDADQKLIKVSDVFDTRQNPTKMKRVK